MSKKWKNIWELNECINKDDTLDSVPGSLKCLTYAPNIGYRCWIFKYNGTLVVLGDIGNGHYTFDSAATYLDLLFARIAARSYEKAFRRR